MVDTTTIIGEGAATIKINLENKITEVGSEGMASKIIKEVVALIIRKDLIINSSSNNSNNNLLAMNSSNQFTPPISVLTGLS